MSKKIELTKDQLFAFVAKAFDEGSLIDDMSWNQKRDELSTRNQQKITLAFFEESDICTEIKSLFI